MRYVLFIVHIVTGLGFWIRPFPWSDLGYNRALEITFVFLPVSPLEKWLLFFQVCPHRWCQSPRQPKKTIAAVGSDVDRSWPDFSSEVKTAGTRLDHRELKFLIYFETLLWLFEGRQNVYYMRVSWLPSLLTLLAAFIFILGGSWRFYVFHR